MVDPPCTDGNHLYDTRYQTDVAQKHRLYPEARWRCCSSVSGGAQRTINCRKSKYILPCVSAMFAAAENRPWNCLSDSGVNAFHCFVDTHGVGHL